LICPAPERYCRWTQDQEEDFIEDRDGILPKEDDKNSTDQEEMKPLIEVSLGAPSLVGSTRAPQ
jgi:hypothetical protein